MNPVRESFRYLVVISSNTAIVSTLIRTATVMYYFSHVINLYSFLYKKHTFPDKRISVETLLPH